MCFLDVQCCIAFSPLWYSIYANTHGHAESSLLPHAPIHTCTHRHKTTQGQYCIGPVSTESHMFMYTCSAVRLCKIMAQFAWHYVWFFVSKICKVTLLFSAASNKCKTFLGLAVFLSTLSFCFSVIMFVCLFPLEISFSLILVLPISLTSFSQPSSPLFPSLWQAVSC